MKKINWFLIVFLACLPFVITSCSDDDDEEVTPAIVGTWSLTRIDDSSNSQNPTTTAETGRACTFDDIFTFNVDNTFTFTEGASKCNESDPDEFQAGTWASSGNSFTIDITSAPNGYFDVGASVSVTVSGNSLVLSQTLSGGGTYALTLTRN